MTDMPDLQAARHYAAAQQAEDAIARSVAANGSEITVPWTLELSDAMGVRCDGWIAIGFHDSAFYASSVCVPGLVRGLWRVRLVPEVTEP